MIYIHTIMLMHASRPHKCSACLVPFYNAILVYAIVALIHDVYLVGCTMAGWVTHLAAAGVAGHG